MSIIENGMIFYRIVTLFLIPDRISKGLEIKPDKTLSNGFRIGLKDGSAFYDYSAESVAELFSAYLNPRVAAILKQAASEAK